MYIKKDEIQAWYERLIDGATIFDSNGANSATLKSLLLNFLLLNFLPNVQRMMFCHLERAQSTEVAKTIRTISATNRDAPEPVRDRLSLTNLSEIDIDTAFLSDEDPCDTGLLESLMTLTVPPDPPVFKRVRALRLQRMARSNSTSKRDGTSFQMLPPRSNAAGTPSRST